VVEMRLTRPVLVLLGRRPPCVRCDSVTAGFSPEERKVEDVTFRTTAYLEGKPEENKSMPIKWASPKMCRVVWPASPVRRVKLFVEPEFCKRR
jgi:hypothetical protein